MNNQIVILSKAKYLLYFLDPSRAFRMTQTLNVAKVQKNRRTKDIIGQQSGKKGNSCPKSISNCCCFSAKKVNLHLEICRKDKNCTKKQL